MPNQCEQIRQEYGDLKALKQRFDLEYKKEKAEENSDLAKSKELKAELEQKIEALQNKVWPFEALSLEKVKEQYEKAVSGYREFGWLKALASGQEGIIDETGQEYPIPSFGEITKGLLADKEFFAEKFATLENPRIHLTPFALSPAAMADDYGQHIEDHFVAARVDGDARIPDKAKTKLFGADGQPLELRADKQNIYFDNSLKNLNYFPEWQKKGASVKAVGGLTKEEALAKLGGWRMIIIEDTPLAPEKGQGKIMEKEIKIKGKTKKVKRTQIEGGLNAAEQYELLKRQNETGLVPEDWLSFAMLHLKEKNMVLDDDKRTNYLCRLLGVRTAGGGVPGAGWYRGLRRAGLYGAFPGVSGSGDGVRGAVGVYPVK